MLVFPTEAGKLALNFVKHQGNDEGVEHTVVEEVGGDGDHTEDQVRHILNALLLVYGEV